MDWRRTRHEVPSAFAGPLSVEVARPSSLSDDVAAPLLWVHDGPAYDTQAGLVDWAQEQVAGGGLPQLRMAMADVRRRTQWYSASPRYRRSFSMGLSELERSYAVRAPVAVMGASLGGLTSLLVGLADDRVGAVFAQSGSFFTATTDAQESGFVRFGRIVAAVERIEHRPAQRHVLRVALTCCRDEENLANNRLMATTLAATGVDVELTEVSGGHDYPSWRAALEPALPGLLRRVWD